MVERAGSQDPGPRLAVVRGDAGVGKSRLLRAAAEEAAAAGCLVLAGWAGDRGGRVPYAPLVDALGHALDGRPADARLAGPGQHVRRLLELAAQESGAAPPPGLAQAPAAVAERVIGLLRGWSAEETCVLVLDDLHAADEDTLALLARLVARLPSMRCAVLAAVRSRPSDLPVAVAAFLERLHGMGQADVHELAPLTAEDAERLAACWLGAPPDADLAARLWSSCRGNPFYLEQAVRHLAEEHALTASAGGRTVGSGATPTLARRSLVELGGAAGLKAFVVKDDFSAPPPGKARLRIINGAPQSPPLDIGTAGGPVLFENVGFGKVSPFVAVPAGSLSLEARMAGTSRVLFSQGASRLPAGTILTVAGTVTGSGAIEMVPIIDAAGARSLPRGGVATGAGGTAGPRPPAPWLAGLILLLGTAAAARRRPGRSTARRR